MGSSFLRLIGATRGLAEQRAIVRERARALGPAAFARELEPAMERSALGHDDGRSAQVAIAAWAAHLSAEGAFAAVESVGSAAREAGLVLVGAILSASPPRRALARGGRLAEVGVAVYRSLDGMPARHGLLSIENWRQHRAWVMGSTSAVRRTFIGEIDRLRAHHDATFIGRLLDQRWIRVGDVIQIAARRPTTAPIALAIATRDRWLIHPSVREALVSNAFTPAPLTLALLPAASASALREIVRSGSASPVVAAARLVLSYRDPAAESAASPA